MGRKTQANRGRRLTIRVTDAEFAEYMHGARKLKLTMSDYVRYWIKKGDRLAVDNLVEMKGLQKTISVDLSNMGNNLNQAMRAVNSLNKGENKAAVEKSVNELWNVFLDIKKKALELWETIAPLGVKKRRKEDATE